MMLTEDYSLGVMAERERTRRVIRGFRERTAAFDTRGQFGGKTIVDGVLKILVALQDKLDEEVRA